LGLRVSLLLILSSALFFCELHSDSCHYFRAKLSVLALPVQKLVDAPIRLVSWVSDTVVTQRYLLSENARLRADALMAEAKLQRLLALQRENEQLRQLLNSSSQLDTKTVVAQLLAIDLDPSLQQVIIDKGTQHAIYEGQPVLDSYGVMGQVISVGPYTSRVLLISDTRSAVPVQDSRSGVRAIAVGLGSNQQLSLIHIPDTADIQEGDIFVSSGLGQRFPSGYPVGEVTERTVISGEQFILVKLKPTAHLDRTEQVLLVWPAQSLQDKDHAS